MPKPNFCKAGYFSYNNLLRVNDVSVGATLRVVFPSKKEALSFYVVYAKGDFYMTADTSLPITALVYSKVYSMGLIPHLVTTRSMNYYFVYAKDFLYQLNVEYFYKEESMR